MLKLKRTAGLLAILLIFGAGAYLGMRLGWRTGMLASPRIYSTPVLLERVQTLSELVTVKYVLEKFEGMEVPSKNALGQALGSENRVLLLAHGIVKAGVDLKRLRPENLQVTGARIVIQLPPAQILDAYLDENQTKVVDRKTGLLAPPDKDLEQTVRQNAIDDIRRAARTGGILKDAEERAQAQLAGLFLQLGFQKVEFAPAPASGPSQETLTLAPRENGAKESP